MTQQPPQPPPVSRQRVQSALRRGGYRSAAQSSGGYRVAEEDGELVVRYSTPQSRYSEEYAAKVRAQLERYLAALAEANIPAHITDTRGGVPWLICAPAQAPAESPTRPSR